MNMDYYSDHYLGKFVNQRILTDKLTNPELFIKEQNATPLTTCLLIAKESLIQMQNEIVECNRKLKNAFQQKDLNFGTRVNFEFINTGSGTSGSAMNIKQGAISLATVGAATPIDPYFCIKDNYIFPKNEDGQFREIIAYIHLYTYFSSYESTLDRFALTLNSLFKLGIKKITWGQLANNISNYKDKNHSTLFSELAKTIKNFNNKNCQNVILMYRNRFVHYGHCRMDIQSTNNIEWKITLPRNPSDAASICDFDVLVELPRLFDELIDFLNKCYGIICTIIDQDTQPPWKTTRRSELIISLRKLPNKIQKIFLHS